MGVAPIRNDGNLETDPERKADLLNAQFKSVFVQESQSGPVPSLSGTPFANIRDLHITTKGVEKLLENLNVHKASGPDQIPNTILKNTAKQIAPVLQALFTQSLQQGTLPKDWTSANVSPVFKKGDRHAASNYRPISLTCVCCKVLEHIIVKHILDHLEKHNILVDNQHGFRSGHSCDSQLILTIHDIVTAADMGNRVDMIFLDFSKAFDMVPHRRLLSKLKHYGITGSVLSWIDGFLSHRTQRVVVEGSSSGETTVDSGVPQGSVLGPLLFLLFINDLPSQVTSSCRLFADDCVLYRPIKDQQDNIALQNDLKRLEEWTGLWGMKFNATKCYVVSTNKGGTPYFYELNNHILQYVSSNPYLGVLISEDLTFETHISRITKKASSKLGFLKRNLKGCPEDLKQLGYYALVRSGLEYASTAWDPILQKDIDAIERIQREAARFTKGIYHRGPDVSVTRLIEELGWESLQERRKIARLIMLYKAVNGEVALPIDNILEKADSRTRGSTQNNFKHIRSRKRVAQQSFFVRTVPDWNILATETKAAPSSEAFKTRVRKR